MTKPTENPEEELMTAKELAEKENQQKTLSEVERMKKLEEEIKELKEKNLHLLADMENLRKRLLKEKLEMNRFAIDNVLTEILGPLDNFENALGFTGTMSEETKNWAIGFEMILNQFKETLSYNNVRPFSAKGELFDPHRHEAVEVVETDEVPEGTITEELVKGYESGDRVLRPARVKVAKPVKKIKNQEKKEEE